MIDILMGIPFIEVIGAVLVGIIGMFISNKTGKVSARKEVLHEVENERMKEYIETQKEIQNVEDKFKKELQTEIKKIKESKDVEKTTNDIKSSRINRLRKLGIVRKE